MHNHLVDILPFAQVTKPVQTEIVHIFSTNALVELSAYHTRRTLQQSAEV